MADTDMDDHYEVVRDITNSVNKTALIAMSGGVDSSVAAWLMKQNGYSCMGTTMRLYRNVDIGISQYHPCCSQKDIDDAADVAFSLDIPFEVLDFTMDFHEKIIDRFVRTYEAGGTPNPCIDCNRFMKFDKLLDFADEKGLLFVVTGHYARVSFDEKSGRYILRKAVDESKDQSYVLYTLTQKQLARVKFPLGEMKKSETREIAERLKLCNARKHDSQDICFIPDGDYVNFMEKYTGRHYPDGNFLDESGNVVGIHHGAVRYTIGQRKGLGLSMEEPVYVCEKDMQANTVTVGTESSMLVRGMMVGDLNWISVKGLSDRQYDGSLCECEITKVPSDDETGYDDFDMIHQTETKIWKPLHVSVRTRYHGSESGAMLYQDDGDRSKVRMIFDEPQKRAAVGQAAVFYDGDIVVGGGTIESMIL